MPRLTTQSDVTNPQRKGYDFRIDNFLLRAAIGPTQDRQLCNDIDKNYFKIPSLN